MSTTTTTGPKPQDEILERLQRLVERAEQGDVSVLGELRAALDANAWVWERYGDLAQQSMAAWLQLIAGSNIMLHESTRRKTEQLREELTGPEPSPLEKLLIERIVSCWLQVNYTDAAYAQMKGNSPAQHTAAQRRQGAAQQRYLQAMRALVTIRKLLRPTPSPIDFLSRPVAETGTRTPAKPAPEASDRRRERVPAGANLPGVVN
jgi:hypothetical protein